MFLLQALEPIAYFEECNGDNLDLAWLKIVSQWFDVSPEKQAFIHQIVSLLINATTL